MPDQNGIWDESHAVTSYLSSNSVTRLKISVQDLNTIESDIVNDSDEEPTIHDWFGIMVSVIGS